ncbi:hypothetical protein B9N66_06965 [Campylobacter concisus]|uniref:hypothetical protein n=1 Tax=Campylobacter concisus TaxID=199 RepID=UPI000B3D6FAE|nr:hypothetical protein [Campylobacter concisus]OUT08672.1 hypothetical protein B9N66_06965 [Campylobacter concisus]
MLQTKDGFTLTSDVINAMKQLFGEKINVIELDGDTIEVLSDEISRTPLVQVSPVTPEYTILGTSSDAFVLSLSLKFPLRVEHLVTKVGQSLKNSNDYKVITLLIS